MKPWILGLTAFVFLFFSACGGNDDSNCDQMLEEYRSFVNEYIQFREQKGATNQEKESEYARRNLDFVENSKSCTSSKDFRQGFHEMAQLFTVTRVQK